MFSLLLLNHDLILDEILKKCYKSNLLVLVITSSYSYRNRNNGNIIFSKESQLVTTFTCLFILLVFMSKLLHQAKII